MQLTKVRGGYIPGTSRKPLSVPRAPPFLPLVCYEIVFPGEAVPRGERPGWLVNLTNDGWFGRSSGPYQHLQQARVRAIEEGPAAGACRQYRRLGGDRSARPDHRLVAARYRRGTRCGRCRGRSSRLFMPVSAMVRAHLLVLAALAVVLWASMGARISPEFGYKQGRSGTRFCDARGYDE
jgi:hypothetical protein